MAKNKKHMNLTNLSDLELLHVEKGVQSDLDKVLGKRELINKLIKQLFSEIEEENLIFEKFAEILDEKERRSMLVSFYNYQTAYEDEEDEEDYEDIDDSEQRMATEH